jgi:predicted translin family RNA/ssDNA-binding protein
MGGLKKLAVSDEVFVAGICDVPGELYRYAIRAATARDFLTVKKCAEAADEIIGELVEFNLTSYLRNKFDQAKQALHKLEQVVYETSLRQ